MNPQMYQDLIRTELGGVYGCQLSMEMDEILRCYALYEGAPRPEDAPDGMVRTNWIKKLINDETRYMAARPPELRVTPRRPRDQAAADELTAWLKDRLDENAWSRQLLGAMRDACIGKRVALRLSYDARDRVRLRLRFAPSLEFIYDPDERDPGVVQKAVFFYYTTPPTVTDRARQRVWKQRYQRVDGRCRIDEGVYDGFGRPIEITHNGDDTGLDFVPVYVVLNGGLSGDLLGESDALELADLQAAYDRTRSDDLDALKYQMFGQKLFIDASPESMENILIEPNAMIDIQTEPGSPHQAQAQSLETSFAYGDHLDSALERLCGDMHALVSVPRITPELLTGLGTSGKAMRALYWSLNCRCEERWACGWDAMLRWMAESMFRLARAAGERLPKIDYALSIEHLYPILDDDEEERARDLQEVSLRARSRRSYIAKWQTDGDPDGELRQIQMEDGRAPGVETR